MRNEKIIVMGASKKRGKAIAAFFINLEADISVFAINQNLLNQKVITKKLDILKEFGHTDILVNNEKISKHAFFAEKDRDEFDSVIEVNLKSIYYSYKVLVYSMMKNKKGEIINISSICSLIGSVSKSYYTATKAGIIGFIKSLVQEMGFRNICVNAIASDFTQSDMIKNIPKELKNEIKYISLKKIGKPQADATIFLAGDRSDLYHRKNYNCRWRMAM